MHDKLIESHIISIIQTGKIKEQAELQEELAALGFHVPQATLSRKLKKMKIAKLNGIYTIIEMPHPVAPPVLAIVTSDTGLIVLHTYPGHASGLAYILDIKYVAPLIETGNNSGILGTLAGDDTVLIITKSPSEAARLTELLKKEFGL